MSTTPSDDSNSTRIAPSAQLSSDPDTLPLETSTRYKLCKKRTPRYRCGICGLRDCVYLLQINVDSPIETRGADLVKETHTHDMVSILVIRTKNTYTGLEEQANYPLERILFEMPRCEVVKAPFPRFKERTHDNKGLEFTLARDHPSHIPNIVFGLFNFKREPIQIAPCTTADLLHNKYGISVKPGKIYGPTNTGV